MAAKDKQLARKASLMKKSLEKKRLPVSVTEEGSGQIIIHFSTSLPQQLDVPGYILLANGMMPDTCNVIITALPGKPLNLSENLDATAAFLNQLSMVLSPFHFLLDLPSRQVLMRQNLICTMDVQPDPTLFIRSVQQLSNDLTFALARLESEQRSVRDARLMANFLSESCYEATLP